jgi:hypothetical protein
MGQTACCTPESDLHTIYNPTIIANGNKPNSKKYKPVKNLPNLAEYVK